MRIGVVVCDYDPAVGGGHTFQASLLAAIRATACRHFFILLDMGRGRHESDGLAPCVNLRLRYLPVEPPAPTGGIGNNLRRWRDTLQPRWLADRLTRGARVARAAYQWMVQQSAGKPRPASEPPSLLDRAVEDYELDLIWFLAPALERLSVPFIATVWDLQHRVQPYFPEVSVTGWTWDSRELTYRTMLPRAARVVTGTQTGKDEIVRFYGVYPDNIAVIPFPVPHHGQDANAKPVDVRQKYGLPQDFLLYPAQFWPHKNHVNVLLALHGLKKAHALPLDMVFVGSDKGNQDYVRKVAQDLELSDQAHFLGFVPDQDLVALYQNAFALIFASFFGPDNLPPLEAFALGCPVIASKVSGAEEQLGDAALLFDPKNPAALAEAINRLQGDSCLREELIRKGRERAGARSGRDYLMDICCLLDDFESIRRCWGRHYRHT